MTRRRYRLLVVVVLVCAPILIWGGVLLRRRGERIAREATEKYQREIQLRDDKWVSDTKKALRAGRQSEVHFYSTSHTDKMVHDFAGMPEVKSLVFELTDFSDAGMKDVAGLPNLVQLTIYGGNPRVGDNGLRFLAGNQSLKKLVLANTDVTDDGLRVLASLPALVDLALCRDDFREPRLTDAAVEDLSKLSKLKRLEVSGGWMSEAALEKLRNALPHCKVICIKSGYWEWLESEQYLGPVAP